MINYTETNLNNSPGETISCSAIVDSLVLVFARDIRASSNTLLQREIGVYYPLQRAIHSMTSM